MIITSSVVRHLLFAVILTLMTHILWIVLLDTPKIIYHCPLNPYGVLNQWNNENCYCSSSYSEAREKFVSMGNILRDQIRRAKKQSLDHVLDIVDIRSISYDVSDEGTLSRFGSFAGYIDSAVETVDVDSFQHVHPGLDTMDAILLTVRNPSSIDSSEKYDIIHSCGVHGAEGYLGSAVQIHFLHELILGNEDRLERRANATRTAEVEQHRILLIHAVNPYGMRHHRRSNENNVDLNRNTLSAEQWDFVRSRDPNFAGYVDHDSVFNPFTPLIGNVTHGELFSWVTAATQWGFGGDVTMLERRDDAVKAGFQDLIGRPQNDNPYNSASTLNNQLSLLDWITDTLEIPRLFFRIVTAVLTMGYLPAKSAFVSSQYLKPCGSQYGGGAHPDHQLIPLENSIIALRHTIDQFAGFTEKDKMIWIDVHTGLGKYGNYVISQDFSDTLPEQDWMRHLKTVLENSQFHEVLSRNNITGGYEMTLGFVNSELLCSPPGCRSITQEFGTRPGLFIALCLVMENMGYQRGSREYEYLTSWAFNPQRLSWRRDTMRGGVELLRIARELLVIA